MDILHCWRIHDAGWSVLCTWSRTAPFLLPWKKQPWYEAGVECCVHEAICKYWDNYWNEICSSWDVNIRPSLITSQMLLPLSYCTNDREVTSSIHIIFVEASVKFQLILMCSSSVVDHQKIQYNWTGWLSWHLSTYKCARTQAHTHTCTHTHTLCRLYNSQWYSAQLGITEMLEIEIPKEPPKPEKVTIYTD